MDKFILPRKTFAARGEYPLVRVPKKTYEAIAELAAASGLSLATVIGKAVEFATARLVFIDETDYKEGENI